MRFRDLWIPLTALVAQAGCSTPTEDVPRGLGAQLRATSARFFEVVRAEGVAAQSNFALFVPEGTVNRRHLERFRSDLEASLHGSAGLSALTFNGAADRVFFLSTYRPEGWTTPTDQEHPADVLAGEFYRGTREGWTAFHAYWDQFNRLLIGDTAWIQALPDSVRADLSHPVKYVLRVSLSLDESPNLTTFRHTIVYDLLEVGKERLVVQSSSPLILTYALP